jgi:hypothetical protein
MDGDSFHSLLQAFYQNRMLLLIKELDASIPIPIPIPINVSVSAYYSPVGDLHVYQLRHCGPGGELVHETRPVRQEKKQTHHAHLISVRQVRRGQ